MEVAYYGFMNNLVALILPAALGLIAGISHGVVSHQADLPMSLNDQITQPFSGSQVLRD